jgi:hypothetical protein
LTNRFQAPDERLRSMQRACSLTRARVLFGGDFDSWDLEVRGGMLGAARLLTAVEDYSGVQQLIRARTWARCLPRAWLFTGLFSVLCVAAAADRAWTVAGVLALLAVLIAVRAVLECAAATAVVIRVFEHTGAGEA